jgi:nitronate monooxygenase
MQQFLEELGAEHNLTFEKQDISLFKYYTYHQQIDILINEKIPLVSFTFGIPDDESIKKLKANGIILVGTATCLKEAMMLDEKGIDIICAQGIEAGGHRGTFLENDPLPLIGTMSLVTQVVNHVNKPVIAAGGITDGKTISAAFALGAEAVQIGTAFIASDESLAVPSYKAALQNASDTDTVLTRAFSGRWARGISNKMMAALDNSGILIPPYPVQNSITTTFRAVAQKQDNNQLINMWAGQSAFKAKAKPCTEIFSDLINQAGK